jgi:hypothetical protein
MALHIGALPHMDLLTAHHIMGLHMVHIMGHLTMEVVITEDVGIMVAAIMVGDIMDLELYNLFNYFNWNPFSSE